MITENLNFSLVEGTLADDPRIFFTGVITESICEFPLAVKFNLYNQDGTKTEEVSFIKVKTFGDVAEACYKYLREGERIRVKGKLKQDWIEKEGKKITFMLIEAATVDFLKKGERE